MKSFITTLSTDDYIHGVVNLNKSLVQVNSKYPLIVYADKSLKKETFDRLTKENIQYIVQDKKLELPMSILENNAKNGVSHWSNTFIKLDLFKLIDFEKLVYLDSDMMVLNNIDELFNKPHMSSVIAGREFKGNSSWHEFNSGLMVIEPRIDALNGIENHIIKISKEKSFFGDQDILNSFYNDWIYKNDLHLNSSYNMFILYTDYYVKKLGFKLLDKTDYAEDKENIIKVVHFTGINKPWMLSKKSICLKFLKLIIKHKTNELKIYMRYFNL